jgi:serine protease AprX
MKKIVLPVSLVFSFLSAFCQGPDKYIVFFTDKYNSPYQIDNPSEYLSPRAIQRRTDQQIAIDSSDLPVNPSYLQQVANTGAIILCRSRWINSATVQTNDPVAVAAISGFPFVKDMKKVYGSGLQRQANHPAVETAAKTSSDPYYGPSFRQIEMLNGHLLHQLGYRGKGKVIAVIDAGFFNANNLAVFDSLFANGQIKGTWDFVSNNANVYYMTMTATEPMYCRSWAVWYREPWWARLPMPIIGCCGRRMLPVNTLSRNTTGYRLPSLPIVQEPMSSTPRWAIQNSMPPHKIIRMPIWTAIRLP